MYVLPRGDFYLLFTSTVRVLFLITDDSIFYERKRSEDFKEKRKKIRINKKEVIRSFISKKKKKKKIKLQDKYVIIVTMKERNIVLFRGFIFMSTVITNRYQF